MENTKRLLKVGKKRQESDSTHGVKYEIKLLILFLLRTVVHDILDFKLLTNLKGYGCWDDLIIQYSYLNTNKEKETRIALVQAKHSQTGEKTISLRQFQTRTNDKNFCLSRYFNDYEEHCMEMSQGNNIPIDLIMYTNMKFCDNLFQGNWCVDDPDSKNNMSFKLLGSCQSNVATKLNYNTFKNNRSQFNDLFVNKTEDSVKKFLLNLSYYLRQSSESTLDDLIMNEFKSYFNEDDDKICEEVYRDVYKQVEAWKNNMTAVGSKPLTQNSKVFELARENAIFFKIKSKYKMNFERSPYKDVEFTSEYLSDVVQEAKDSVVNVFTSKNALTLTTLKVFQAFNKLEPKPVIIDMKSFAKYYKFSKFSLSEAKQVVIIQENYVSPKDEANEITDSKETLIKILAQILNRNTENKIILIRTDKEVVNFNQGNGIEQKISDKFNLQQFTPESRTKILNKEVRFQGMKVRLNSLINNEFASDLSPDVLTDIIEDKLEIQPKVVNLLGPVESYYIKRNFYRDDIVKKSVLTDESFSGKLFIYSSDRDDFKKLGDVYDIFASDNGTNYYKTVQSKVLILSSDVSYVHEVFDEFCNKNKFSEMHLLQAVTEKSSERVRTFLKWKKTNSLMKSFANMYLEKHEISPGNINNEEEFLVETRNYQINLITDIAGMGKSCVLKSLYHQDNANVHRDLILHFDLVDLYRVLLKIENKQHEVNPDAALLILLKQIVHNEEQVRRTILFTKNKKIRIYFDSFDEINNNAKSVIKRFLECLIKNTKITIYIASRPNLQDELESMFLTISYKLVGFTSANQLEFLNKLYCTKVTNASKPQKINEFSNHLLEIFQKKMDSSVQNVAGIPLLTRMIAEIYLERLKAYLEKEDLLVVDDTDTISLYKMYDEFISSKCNVYYREKLDYDSRGDKEQRIIDLAKQKTMEMHKILSVYAFCVEEGIDSNEMLSCEESIQLQEILDHKSENAVGIVSEIKEDGDITFAHRTFAEFLFAKRILENLKRKFNLQNIKKLNIFTNGKYKLLRLFIDSYLSENYVSKLPVLYKAIVDLKLHENKTTPLVSAAQERNYWLSNLFIDSINERYKDAGATTSIKSLNAHIQDASEVSTYPLLQRTNINAYRQRFINQLIKKKDNKKLNALHYAIINTKNKKSDIVSLLLSQITEIESIDDFVFNGKTILHLSVAHCTLDIVQKIIQFGAQIDTKSYNGDTPLYVASTYGCYDIVQYLLGCGADINKTCNLKETSLHAASGHGHSKVVSLLLDRGAEINAKGHEGNTALHLAISFHKNDVVQLLLDHGADINERNKDGDTALHLLARYGNRDSIIFLLERDADVSAVNNKGETPMLKAAYEGNVEFIDYLLSTFGFDIDSQNIEGDTMLHIAAGPYDSYWLETMEADYNSELIKYLIQNGARVDIENKRSKTLFGINTMSSEMTQWVVNYIGKK